MDSDSNSKTREPFLNTFKNIYLSPKKKIRIEERNVGPGNSLGKKIHQGEPGISPNYKYFLKLSENDETIHISTMASRDKAYHRLGREFLKARHELFLAHSEDSLSINSSCVETHILFVWERASKNFLLTNHTERNMPADTMSRLLKLV